MNVRRTWNPFASVALVWSCALAASLLTAARTSARVPGFIEAFVNRPVTLLTLAIFTTFVMTWVARERPENQWHDMMRITPWAMTFGVLAAWTGLWNDGSGTAALPLRDAATFIVSAGILPRAVGPEALLRAAALVIAIMNGIRAAKQRATTRRAVLVGVTSWLASSAVLLAQTWLAHLVAARDFTISHSQDAMRALGLAHVNAYWSNFQSDRFFSGVGKQLETGVALSSSVVLFVASCVVLTLLARRIQPWARADVPAALVRHLATIGWRLPIAASGLLAGVIVGSRSSRLAWSGLDVAALAVLLIVFLAWFAWWSFGRDLENLPMDERDHPDRPLPSGIVTPHDVEMLREVLACVFFVGGLLLGWPVFLPFLAVAAVEWLWSSEGFGWSETRVGRIAQTAVTVGILTIAGGMFAARGTVFPQSLMNTALLLAILTIVANLLPLGSFATKFRKSSS